MSPCETPEEHPAELLKDCTDDRPIEYTANVEYVSAASKNGRRISATGYGYGHGETREAAEALAEQRAMEHAAEQLKYKLTIFGAVKKHALMMVESVWLKLGGTKVVQQPLVNEKPPQPSLIAPVGTRDCNPIWEGRIAKKPWEYACTVGIPHLNTPEALEMAIRVIRCQTVSAYIIVVDTGSDDRAKEHLERLRAEDVEIHYIAAHAYEHSSEPVSVAMDLIQALCRTTHLFQTHADVFLRRYDFLESLILLVDDRTPAVGYRMSPRDWISNDWEKMIGHTASMFYMPSIHRCGITWSMQRMKHQWGVPMKSMGGWPDTETGFNYALQEAGIRPVFIGHDRNYERQIDDNIDHVRSHTGTMIYAQGDMHQKCENWMTDAMIEAEKRIQLSLTRTKKQDVIF